MLGSPMNQRPFNIRIITWHAVLLVLLGCLTSPVFAACTHPGGAGNTPTVGTTVNCTGTTVLTQTFWTGANDLTFNFDGTVDASALTELLRVDTYGNGNIGWTAENIRVNNNAAVTVTRNAGFLQGFLIGAGDQNNPTNGNFVFTNTGSVTYTNNQNYGAIYLLRFWSPTDTAQLNNEGSMLASADRGYPILVYQQQRGETNNAAGASITASGLYAYAVIHDVANAGWVAGSGFAPNYLSSAFTEERNFVLNNAGTITASIRPSGGGATFYSSYPQGSIINNTGTMSLEPDDVSDAGNVIYYDTRSTGATADIRPQLTPYTINNDGLIQYTGSSANGRAIYVRGKSFDGVDVPAASRHPDAFNPDVHTNNNGTITGSITLADGNDRIALNDGSNTTSPTIMMAGGLDQLLVANVASLTTDELNGGGNAVIGDETGWDDVLTFERFVGSAPPTLNWEYININADAQVTLTNNTQAGQVATNSTGVWQLPDGHSVQANVANNGSASMVDGSAGTFSVQGDASGSGVLLLDVDVSTGDADVLTVSGNTTGSTMQIDPRNISAGAASNQDIEIIRVGGTTATGDFVMLGGGTSYVPSGLAAPNQSTCDSATVSVEVNKIPDVTPPAAQSDAASTAPGVPVTIDVLANDSDDEALDAGSVRVFNESSGQWVTTLTLTGVGTYTVNADGSVTFVSAPAFLGVSTVRY